MCRFRLFVFVFVWLSAMTSSSIAKLRESGNIGENDVVSVRQELGQEQKLKNLLTFNMENIMKIREEAQLGKNEEISSKFKKIGPQLAELNNIRFDNGDVIELMGETYFDDLKKIWNSLWRYELHVQYLNSKSYNFYGKGNEKNFFETAESLPYHLTHFMRGLLGVDKDVDILTNWRNYLNCNGPMLERSMNFLMRTLTTGIWLHYEYQQIIKAIDSTRSKTFEAELIEISKNLIKRINEQVFQCRMDERNITKEMGDAINKTFGQHPPVENVAKALLHFLDDKYDTKKWIVVVSQETGDSKKLQSVQSAGFHSVSRNGISAAAISFSPELSWTKVNERMKEFKFPIESRYNADISYSLREKVSARDVFDYLNRYISPLRSNRSETIIESLVITTPCASTKKTFDFLVSVVSSNNTEYLALNNNGSCINHLVVIAPVKPFNSTATAVQDLKCYTDGVQKGLLRNEFGQAYLSVMDNSLKEEAYIILDPTWKNVAGQRWEFVNNQLVNAHGKCLTAWALTSKYLYQYDCHLDWIGQLWYRHGLNIVNGFNLCLAYKNSPNGQVMYLVQSQCDSTPPYLWYDWDADCEDAMVIPSIGNESRPLKNEFTRRYLTISTTGYAVNEPWNNEAGQNWKFVDGQLKNDNGKCLAGKGGYVYEVNCPAENTKQNSMWKYNDKRQIVSASGYCLGAGDVNGYIQYNHCSDGLEYRWL